MKTYIFVLTLLICNSVNSTQSSFKGDKEDEIFASSFELIVNDNVVADVISVTTTGSNNNYNFSVGISSPDISCIQYADWWEVLDANGLIHRRILGHSHSGSQNPFIRSSGPVIINSNEIVWVRAHMNNGGYGGAMYTGSVTTGFSLVPYENLWDSSVEFEEPQVTNCAF